MKIGDLVTRKVNPQGLFLVTVLDVTGRWFVTDSFGTYNTWLSVNEYEAINENR